MIDALRPVTAELWLGLSLEERRRFLRHVRPYWDIHRHRMAPPAADAFDGLLADGILQLDRGRVRGVECYGNHAYVTVQKYNVESATH